MNLTQKNSKDLKTTNLPEETLEAMEDLGLILKSIYLRLKREGYTIVDGKLIEPDEYDKK